MSGIIGHTMYAILAAKATRAKKLPIASVIERHFSSYLAGSYLGCDVQTLPAAICVDTGKEVGYGSSPLKKSPLTGGEVCPWTLKFGGKEYSPREVQRMFYGRSHLVLGWSKEDRHHALPWDHLPDLCALVVEDAIHLFGPGERKLAYLFGWMTHIVGDSLIKSVQPGMDLELLDGKYTPTNRPIQDLVTFHEIGRKEFKLNWGDLLADLAQTPVEPVQAHYMRVARPRGELAKLFPNAWQPHHEKLVLHVLAENRRFQAIRNGYLVRQYALEKTDQGWQCNAELSKITGGLSYQEMVEAADKANFRHALWQLGEAIVQLFEQVVERQPMLESVAPDPQPTWAEITERWKAK